MLIVAIYSRKSKSTDRGESVQNQIKYCEDYINKCYGGQEVKILYYNEGEGKSGGDSQRKQFRRLMQDAQRKVYNVLICYRLDRVARSVADFSDLIEELNECKISFISVKEQFDTSTPMGRAMMYIASVFAQLEREIGAERVKDNLMELAKSGRWLGGTTPTGYESEGFEVLSVKEVNENNEIERKKKKAFKLKKVEQEGEILEVLFNKIEEIKSLTGVASYLMNNDIHTRNEKQFTRFTLENIYKNIVYAKNDIDMYEFLKAKGITIYAGKEDFDGKHGLIAYNKTYQQKHKANVKNDMKDWVISVGKHEGYISGKRWINIQNILEKNKDKRARMPRKNKALLSGILRCQCGGYLRPKLKSGFTYKDGSERFFYMCETKELSKKQKCDVNNIDGNALDNELIEQMKSWFAPNSEIIKRLQLIADNKQEETEKEQEINRLQKQYKKNESDLESLIDRLKYIDIDLIDDINKEIKKTKEENKKINEKIKELTASQTQYDIEMPENEVANLAIKVINNYFDAFTNLDIIEQRNILKIFIAYAVWNGKNVEVDLLNTEFDEFFLHGVFPKWEYRQ